MIINDKFKQGNLYKFTVPYFCMNFSLPSFDVTVIVLQVSSSFQWQSKLDSVLIKHLK